MSKATRIREIAPKIAWGLFLLIFGIVAVIALWLSIDKMILKSPVPSLFGYASLTVETGSMQGTIDAGDMVVIKSQKEYRVGDIVTFLHEGDKIPTTHRIIYRNEDGSFLTKGDANNTKDELPVTEDIIIGKVVKVFSGVGIFTTWLRTEGWIYIVACLAVLGLGLFMLSSSEEKNPQSEQPTAQASTPTDEAAEAPLSENNDQSTP